MRSLLAVALLFGVAARTGAQEVSQQYDPKISYGLFAEYSNDSSHIVIGQAENRRLFAAGGSYNRRLKENSVAAWRYQIEVTPILLLRNPRLTFDVTSMTIGNPASIPFQLGTVQYVGLELKECTSGSGSGLYYDSGPNGTMIPVGSYSYIATCSHPWTYGGGISPLGQKVNFLPHGRVQPYAAFNAGFVVFAANVPSTYATMFNFSFEFGGGLEWNLRPGRTCALDYRYHHISNAGRGEDNPGVDNGTFRVSYGFGR